jgi:hypothetical protein
VIKADSILLCFSLPNPTRKSFALACAFSEEDVSRLFQIIEDYCVTIEGVCIGNRIYWTLKHRVRECTLQIMFTHSVVFSVTVFTALLGNALQQWTILCSRAHVLAGWRPSHTKLLLQLLSKVSHVMTAAARYIASTWPHRKRRFQQLLHCCLLHNRYQAVAVSLTPQFLI